MGVTEKAPAILLLPGSGPTDRNGNSGLGIKTDLLKEIAEELAKNGIASLRFDKRAIQIYASQWPKDPKEMNHFFAWQMFVDDASSAFDFLAKQPEVDSTKVAILGHSEGALISLQIGSDRSGKPSAPKATILMGSTGRPMGPILHEQIARQLKLGNATPEVTKQYLDYVDSACKALAENKPLPPNMPPNLGSLFNPTTMDIVGAYCRIDPNDLAKNATGPFLVMNGRSDTQVSAERDTPPLLATLKARKKGTVESLIVPDASHNFKSTKLGNNDAFTGPMDPTALALIIKFAKANL
jgi:alpha-beta hydrolase superfamily lysophospholipase